MPRFIIHGFTHSLAPLTFRPALPLVLTTLTAPLRCTLSHAQIIDSTYILAVDRRVQEIHHCLRMRATHRKPSQGSGL